MRGRLRDRAAALVSIALLAALALGTYYLAEYAGRQRPQAARPGVGHEPDAFAEDFGLTRIDAQGKPVYRVQARRSVHYADDDSTELFEATAISLDPDTPRIVLRADRAVADSKATQTHLYGNVVLTRAADARRAAMELVTDYALVLSDAQVVRTDRPVRITQGRSFLAGVGMEYDNVARRLSVHSQARGSWYDADRQSARPDP